jgi:hypothetical protein
VTKKGKEKENISNVAHKTNIVKDECIDTEEITKLTAINAHWINYRSKGKILMEIIAL